MFNVRVFLWILLFSLFGSSFVFPQDATLSNISNLIINLKYQEAISQLEGAIEKNPKNIPYYYILVDLYLQLGEVSLAEKSIDRARKYEKNNIVINSYLMEVERLKGNLEKSKKISEDLLKNPNSKTNFTFVIMYSRLLSDINLNEAERFLKRYVDTFKNYSFFIEMARIKFLEEDFEGMKKYLDLALSVERFDKRVYSLYGEYYFRVGDYKNAVKFLEKAILFPGKNDREYYLLSQAYFKLGDYNLVLKFMGYLNFGDEVWAKVLFSAGKYSELIKRFKNTESEVVRYFVEEGAIALSPKKISDERKELSEERFKKAVEFMKKGLPFYYLYIKRSIRLNPLNYDAWFELGKYYKFYFSPYTAFEELSVGKNLFVNNKKIQDLFDSIGEYVSNSSKLASWGIPVNRQKNVNILIQIQKVDYPIEMPFYSDLLLWSLSSVKLINTVFTIHEGNQNQLSYKNYDLIVNIKPNFSGSYFLLNISFINPINSGVITNVVVSQRISDTMVSETYNNISRVISQLLPSYGIVEGVDGNLAVVRFSNKFPDISDSVNITSSGIVNFMSGDYKKIAIGKVIDKEGEYALIQLDDQYKYLTEIKKGYMVFKN